MRPSTTLKALLPVMAGLLIIACEPSQKSDDSVDLANEANDEKYENRSKEKDAEFVVNTIATNYEVIELARLASERSENEEIKSIARKLETDHTEIIGELNAYAERKGMSVPVAVPDDHHSDQEKLTETDPEDFDEKLCTMLEKKQQKTIDDFESRGDKTEDPELKSWISSTLPMLKSHLSSLEQHENTNKQKS